jgi:hypothetical protein
MKLNLVKARTGAHWVKRGIQTFVKQPLAMAGLFFMFMALMSLISMIPVLGLPLAMMLIPATTLGLMSATREAEQGKFPMPLILLSAFRADPRSSRAMLTLGLIYAGGFLLAMSAAYLVDGGGFASLYLGGSSPSPELLQSAEFQTAMWVFIGLHLPLSLMVWHAPALVFWHGLSPAKSLFFSLIACLRNFWAFALFGVLWLLVMVLAVLLITTLASLLGSPELAATLMFPALALVASMFFTSLYFTFYDCFSATPDSQH